MKRSSNDQIWQIAIAFDISWPSEVSGSFRYAYLRSMYGPFLSKTNRWKEANLSLWAAWLIDRLGLVFDACIDSCRQVIAGRNAILGMSVVASSLPPCSRTQLWIQRIFRRTRFGWGRVKELIRLILKVRELSPQAAHGRLRHDIQSDDRGQFFELGVPGHLPDSLGPVHYARRARLTKGVVARSRPRTC